MKIIINNCFGGFGISNNALVELMRRKGKEIYFYEGVFVGPDKRIYTKVKASNKSLFVNAVYKDFGNEFIPVSDEQFDDFCKNVISASDEKWRTDDDLINLLEEKGSKYVSGPCSCLKIVEIPDDVEWEVEEYDGSEWISEKHRTWN